MRIGALAGLLLVAMLGACQHARPVQISPVAIPATRIMATTHGLPTVDGPELTPFAQQALDAARKRGLGQWANNCARAELSAPTPLRSSDAHYLVLSGGSLNGAFGAGFFLGLQDKGQLPPEADVVTGVSTGSLQSTFLFLARKAADGEARFPGNDRNYDWVGGMASKALPGAEGSPAPRAGRSDMDDLALAYSITRESNILKPRPLGGIGVLLSGSKGSLTPLRKRLFALVTPETVRAVAAQACRGRKLYVGVTNVDDGFGYALDMTALALAAYDGNATTTRMTQVRQAYVEGLIASSSVPVGAPPVQLRIRLVDSGADEHRRNLFVDGGARFGVFLREIKDAQLAAKAAGQSDVTLIVNTRLSIEPWHAGDLRNPKQGWLLTTLGLRTVDILENQVYQLSVNAVESKADDLRMAFISNENIRNGELPGDHLYSGKRCDEWHEVEEKTLNPVQFYPAYMACLLDYGRARGQRAEWNHLPEH